MTEHLIEVDNQWRNKDGGLWTWENKEDLQLRLCMIAHIFAAGQRGPDSTELTLQHRIEWKTLSFDVKPSASSFIYCLFTTGGTLVPRPLG